MFFDDDKDDDQFSEILIRREGHPTHTEHPASESVDLHQLIEFITPAELMNIVSDCVASTPKLITVDSRTVLEIQCEFGNINLTSSPAHLPWSEDSPTDVITMTVDFNGVFVADGILNQLNLRYEKFQLINYADNLRARSQHTLKGGRTVENLLWTLIGQFHDAERAYKDIVVFSKETFAGKIHS